MIGQAFLILACGSASASLAAAAVPALVPGGEPGNRPSIVAGRLLQLAALSLWAAVAYLAVAILRLDTSFAYVAQQTRPGMSVPLRFSALWSGAEGSLLLFAAICASVLPIGHRGGPRWQQLGTAAIALGLSLAAAVGANPFQRLALPPLSGSGMAPILEHYAMIIHPPLLYIGLCLALSPALVRHPTTAHRLASTSLALLTVALGFGSAWAYVELGWGGWWAWDPIENVALIVWLLLAAGLHWQPLDPDRATGDGPLNAVVIWSLCWPAVLGGAAMTRTSLRTSVHAFADAAQLSVWLWPLTVVAAIGAALRVREQWRKERADTDAYIDTDTDTGGGDRGRTGPANKVPQAVLGLAALLIAAGTYRPFIGGDGTAGWFYSQTLYPLAIMGAVLVGLLPLRRRPDLMRAVLTIAGPGAALMLIAAALGGWRQWFQLLLAAAIGFGGALVVSAGRERGARLAGHLGVLLVLFGALAGTGSTESVVRLNVGQSAEVDGHRVELLATEVISEEPLRAEARILIDGSYRLEPSVSVFPERNLRLPEVSTRTRPWLDSQAVLRDVDPDAGALITVLFRPWNQLVWWGVAALAAAAALAAIPGGQRRSRLALSNSSIDDGAGFGLSGSAGGAGIDAGGSVG